VDRRDELALGSLLEDVAGGAGAEQVAGAAGVALHRQHHDRRPRHLLAQQRHVLGRIGPRHLQVEDEHVRAAIADQPLRRRGVGRLADHPQSVLGLEHRPQAGADHVVVVGENDRNLACHSPNHPAWGIVGFGRWRTGAEARSSER
jgi:hypothetical protein